MNKVALATCAHPDDIEFMMSGTLLLLKNLGWEIHYLNIANGSCGSTELPARQIATVRTNEAKASCESAGFIHHMPITNDLEVFYADDQIRKVAAVVRAVKPSIILTQSPQDYMEDHMNSCRLTVTAAFSKAMVNYITIPAVDAIEFETSIYHACPMGLSDQLKNPIIPNFLVDVTTVMDKKVEMLRKHESQYKFLEETQGTADYVLQMKEQCEIMANVKGGIKYAEGFRQHSHLGYSSADFDPLKAALKDYIVE